jgi:hypothetical protein
LDPKLGGKWEPDPQGSKIFLEDPDTDPELKVMDPDPAPDPELDINFIRDHQNY